ncbi:MAG TPA: MarR family transcriptional regulator [Mesorhizobium sp.]
MSQVEPDTIGFLVADVSRLIRSELDRRVTDAGLGLTPGQGRMLVHIGRFDTALRQTDLAESMGVEAMTVTGFLDRLEAKGLIRRDPDPIDRRAKRIRLTEAGKAMLERIAPLSAGLRADAAAGLSPREWRRFLDTLKTVRANLAAAKATEAAA